jgi:hypothetical protein
MRLAEFILGDMETIVVEWEAFAGRLFPTAATPTRSARPRSRHDCSFVGCAALAAEAGS